MSPLLIGDEDTRRLLSPKAAVALAVAVAEVAKADPGRLAGTSVTGGGFLNDGGA